jgi:protein-S-isoprenylcysteine O-methyltransferase Ste14
VAVRQRRAALGSAAFLLVGPGTVAGVVPWFLTRWQAREPVPGVAPVRAIGVGLGTAGVATLGGAFVRFVREGLGTPLPVAAPTELVVGGQGLYRHVRNPMYVALAAVVIGQALLLGRGRLLGYAAAMSLPLVTYVRMREEPVLQRRFGAQYTQYCTHVPRWMPRLRPWTAGETTEGRWPPPMS